MEDIESLYRRWVNELWNVESLDIIDELFAEDGIAYYPYFAAGEEPIKGRENFKRFVRLVLSKFTDVKAEISELTSVNDRVTALCFISGRLKEEKHHRMDTGEVLKLKGLCRIIFQDGKIREIWNNMPSAPDGGKLSPLEIQNE